MNEIFEQFKKESWQQLNNLKPGDIAIDKDFDLRKYFTLVGRFDKEAVNEIEKIIVKLKSVDPDQYYYPSQQLHLTLIGGIDCNKEIGEMTEKINLLMKNKKLVFDLSCPGSNQYCSSVRAFPRFDLHELREGLREGLGVIGDDYTKHLKYFEYIGWINYMRYMKKPKQDLLDEIKSFKDLDFGKLEIKKLEFWETNTKILDPNRDKLIETFRLS